MNGFIKIDKLYRSVNYGKNRKNTCSDSDTSDSGNRPENNFICEIGFFMEKSAQHGGARAGAGRKKGSTTNSTGYKNGRIVISCLKTEELAIKQKAKEQNKTVSRLIIDSVLKN